MWQKLVELLAKKWLDTQTPRRRAAKALMRLYLSMQSCHEAWLRLVRDPSRHNHRSWQNAINSLSSDLWDLKDKLLIVSPEVYDSIKEYSHIERRAERAFFDALGDTDEAAPSYRACLDEIDQYVSFSSYETPRRVPDDFTQASELLRVLIKDNFTIDEILDA